jgi:hypothetical protein
MKGGVFSQRSGDLKTQGSKVQRSGFMKCRTAEYLIFSHPEGFNKFFYHLRKTNASLSKNIAVSDRSGTASSEHLNLGVFQL